MRNMKLSISVTALAVVVVASSIKMIVRKEKGLFLWEKGQIKGERGRVVLATAQFFAISAKSAVRKWPLIQGGRAKY